MRDLGQLILVHLVEPRTVGSTFPRKRADWPLHITLVPWFVVDETGKRHLLGALKKYTQSAQSFTVRVGDEAKFGPNHDVPVNVITKQAPLVKLHDDVQQIAQQAGGAWQGSASPHSGVHERFIAHITHHEKDGVLHRRYPGDAVPVGDITVGRLLDDNGAQMVQIIDTFVFGDGVA